MDYEDDVTIRAYRYNIRYIFTESFDENLKNGGLLWTWKIVGMDHQTPEPPVTRTILLELSKRWPRGQSVAASALCLCSSCLWSR